MIRYTKLLGLAKEVANDLGNSFGEAETAQQQVETYSLRLRAAYRAAHQAKYHINLTEAVTKRSMIDTNANAYLPQDAGELSDTHMGGARESGAPELPKRKHEADVPLCMDESIPGFTV